MATKRQIEKEFREAGYTVAFKTNRVNQRLCSMYIDTADGAPVVHGTAFSAATIERHRAAFTLFYKYRGVTLRDGQKIV